jgi:hypothetical protein
MKSYFAIIISSLFFVCCGNQDKRGDANQPTATPYPRTNYRLDNPITIRFEWRTGFVKRASGYDCNLEGEVTKNIRLLTLRYKASYQKFLQNADCKITKITDGRYDCVHQNECSILIQTTDQPRCTDEQKAKLIVCYWFNNAENDPLLGLEKAEEENKQEEKSQEEFCKSVSCN